MRETDRGRQTETEIGTGTGREGGRKEISAKALLQVKSWERYREGHTRPHTQHRRRTTREGA